MIVCSPKPVEPWLSAQRLARDDAPSGSFSAPNGKLDRQTVDRTTRESVELIWNENPIRPTVLGVKSLAVALALGGIAVALGGSLWYWVRGSRGLGTPQQRTTYEVLHTAGLAARALRNGLTRESAARSAPALRALLVARATAITSTSTLLAWDGPGGDDHGTAVLQASKQVASSGKALALGPSDLACADDVNCPLRSGVVVPLTSGGIVVGTLVALATSARAGMLRSAGEVARFASTQLELAELDNARARAAEAELRFLRAQISPHFVYNALTNTVELDWPAGGNDAVLERTKAVNRKAATAAVKVYDRANVRLYPRSEEELEAMFAGFDLLDLPAVLAGEPASPDTPNLGWACIARKP